MQNSVTDITTLFESFTVSPNTVANTVSPCFSDEVDFVNVSYCNERGFEHILGR